MLTIRPATEKDYRAIIRWNENRGEAYLFQWAGFTSYAYPLTEEQVSRQANKDGVTLYMAFDGETPIGFAQCGLRRDYVEGADSSPVGYLEGIYVEEAYRRKGYARLLLTACEIWAREQGCTEFASDCELANGESLRFHLSVGFEEANRIICFVKKL